MQSKTRILKIFDKISSLFIKIQEFVLMLTKSVDCFKIESI